jgi:hypothetical protein
MPKKMIKQRNGAKPKSTAIFHPRPVVMNYRGSNQTLRFNSLSGATTSFTVKNILDTVFVATSATVGYELIESFRIRHIEIWVSPSSSNVPVSCSIQYNSNGAFGNGPNRVYEDMCVGNAEPAHLKVAPPRNSLAGMWQNQQGATNALFTLFTPTGSVIDICFDYSIDVGQMVQIANAAVGVNTGQIYGRGLDGIASATTNYPMVNGVYTTN